MAGLRADRALLFRLHRGDVRLHADAAGPHAQRRARQPRACRVHRLQHAPRALPGFRRIGFFHGHRRRPGGAELRDRHRRGRRLGALGRLPPVHLPGRCRLLLRPDHRRGADGAVGRVAVGADAGLAALPGAGLSLHGDGRAGGHRQPGGGQPAAGGGGAAAAAGGLVPGAGRAGAGDAGGRRCHGRDGLPPAARGRQRADDEIRRADAGRGLGRCLGRLGAAAAERRGLVRTCAPPTGRAVGRRAARDRGPGAGGREVTPALELRALHKRFGRTEIIRGASLAVAPGERVAIIGPNGAGKSTLFNLISGRLAPSSGEILLGGQPIHGLPPYEINRRGLARSFQVSHLFPRLSAFENLRCALLWSLGYRYAFWKFLGRLHDANDRADELLRMLQLERRRDVPAMQLSYAEQRALEIGITIAGGAAVVLLDEPTAGMSRSETAHFVDLIRRVTEGRTLLTVEHDMGVVFGLADRIAVLVHGEVIAFDTPAAVRADARVREAYLGPVLAAEDACGDGAAC
ncbi:hypothetical protein CKO37_02985 [Rubrivivax gelatinosus]|nr:hypothetical protein [Rubrivivax gelatinosus]